MRRNNEYSFDGRIRFSEIDHTERITLPGIINYFQDCSIFQSEELGLGIAYLKEHKRAWVLSSWQIVIERYPGLSEEVKVSTWATEFKGMFGNRNFCMRDKDGNVAAYANSLWVYMDMEKGRPTRPEAHEIEVYGEGQALEMEYASRKIELPGEFTELLGIPVRKYHIDTNEHVNNCQYVQMAKEALEEERDIRQVRVEYKKSAVYKDIIIPKTAREEERVVVKLCDTEDKPYAVVEFKWT